MHHMLTNLAYVLCVIVADQLELQVHFVGVVFIYLVIYFVCHTEEHFNNKEKHTNNVRMAAGGFRTLSVFISLPLHRLPSFRQTPQPSSGCLNIYSQSN